MKYDELTDEQKVEAKQRFMIGLADRGCFIRTVYGTDDPERGPSYGELAEAGSLIADEMMRGEDVDYVPEDFSGSESELERLRRTVKGMLTLANFKSCHPGINLDDLTLCHVLMGVEWARTVILDAFAAMERSCERK